MKKSILFNFILLSSLNLKAQLGCCDIPGGPCSPNSTEALCMSVSGTWYDTGGPCDDTTNDCAHGCCEVPLLNSCFGFQTESECLNFQPPGSIWTYTGGDCDNNNPPCLNTTLPIELVSFTATKSLNGIILVWKSTSEINNEGFEIQISYNGIDWDELGFIKGHGSINVVSEYEFSVGSNNLNYGANYFRLKQIDLDGKSSYSNIITKIWTTNSEEIELAPNPVHGKLSITLAHNHIDGGAISYHIIDLLGNKVKNGFLNYSTQTLDVSNLEKGSYFFVVKSQGRIGTSMFIKTQ